MTIHGQKTEDLGGGFFLSTVPDDRMGKCAVLFKRDGATGDETELWAGALSQLERVVSKLSNTK